MKLHTWIGIALLIVVFTSSAISISYGEATGVSEGAEFISDSHAALESASEEGAHH